MRIQAYTSDELRFAYMYHVYYRWQSWRGKPIEVLAELHRAALQKMADEFDIHVLEMKANSTDVTCLSSVRPCDSVSVVASKLKGRLSKWIGQRRCLESPVQSLKAGYFAVTSGKSTTEQVEKYLNTQATHHGYQFHARPPVYVKQWQGSDSLPDFLAVTHAETVLRFHFVLAATNRQGIFDAEAAASVASRWRESEQSHRFVLRKVSFLPDHVHVAVRLHPTVAPGELILHLMNASQELVFNQFSRLVVEAKVERLWQPSAYLGSHGNLASPMIGQYIRNSADSNA